MFFDRGTAEQGYFLTGGTALSEYYLQHRVSDDFDLFNRSSRDVARDAASFQEVLESRGVQVRPESLTGSFARLLITSREGEFLRVDLANDVATQLAPLEHFAEVPVDSFEDIAVNKVCALFRQEPKDYVDLYFILTESSWTLEYLMERARLKDRVFEDPRGHLKFADSLSMVTSFSLPQFMRRPLNLDEMRARLLAEAQRIRERLAPER